ncbi:MAG: hypothetical protein K8L99_15675 [Anaerolineae bacterium]|nr:hypothetical protein [Anaerolineae bacterium]
MLTWKLWRALSQPPYPHPLFQRVYTNREHVGKLQRFLFFMIAYLMICLALTFFWPVFALNPAGLLVTIFAGSNTAFGTLWSDRVSTTIAKEHELDTYDLLCLIPVGAFGAGWTLAVGSLHASPLFRYTGLIMRMLGGVVLTVSILTLGIPMMLSIAHWESQEIFLLFIALWNLCLAAAGFYFDYAQSVVLAHLIGILASTYSMGRLNTRLLSNGTFLLAQVTIYLATFITGFIFLNDLYELLELPQIAEAISLPILRLLLFYGFHEIGIRLVWATLVRQFHGSPLEIAEAI